MSTPVPPQQAHDPAQFNRGEGLMDRRSFLRQGLGFSTLAFATPIAMSAELERPASMLKPGAPFSNYGTPATQDIIRWISANPAVPGNGVSWTPLHQLAGTITPSGLHFERHHNGVPHIDPTQHRLLVHGLVKNPFFLDLTKLGRYPMQSRICFLECGGNSNTGWHEEPVQAAAGNLHGLVSCSEWTGVPLSILLQEAGIKPEARWIVAEGADGAAMDISIPLEKALDDVLLGIYQNGEPLRPENGYPLRLIVPGYEGITWVKWLRRLEITDQPAMARNETAKYTELQPNGKARQFTFNIEAKSLITYPSPGHKLQGTGYYSINGLAWSGKGKIKKVEVSTDGGKTWAEAELQEPILSKSFTRFRFPWQWKGETAVLISRATDETGYVQPERSKLIAERGRNGYFHYNGQVAWAVTTDGTLNHVYA